MNLKRPVKKVFLPLLVLEFLQLMVAVSGERESEKPGVVLQ
jgi:hypothetical protein